MDTCFVYLTISSLLSARKPSVLILFAFEYLILTTSVVTTYFKYVMLTIDARMDGAWTNKSTYMFYLEFITDLVKLFLYLVCCAIAREQIVFEFWAFGCVLMDYFVFVYGCGRASVRLRAWRAGTDF